MLLKILNFLFFQWLFFRIRKIEIRIIQEMKIHSFSIMCEGTFSPMGTIEKLNIESFYAIQFFIVPLTKSKYLGRKFYSIPITTKKLK